MNLKYEDLTVEWLGNIIPMETLDKSTTVAAHIETYLDQMDSEAMGFDIDSYLSAPIMDAKYDKLSSTKSYLNIVRI